MTVIRTIERLGEVAMTDWDRLVSDEGFYLSYNWLRFVEGEAAMDARYLLAFDNDILCGALPLYVLHHPQPTVLLSREHLGELLGVTGEFLVAGAMRGYQTALPMVSDEADRDQTLAVLLEAAAAAAADEGCAAVVLPYLTTEALLAVARVAPVRAAFEMEEAEFTGCGHGLAAYGASSTKRVRSKIKADRVKFARAGWRVEVRQIADCWREAAELLANLERKYGHDERPSGALERTLARQAEHLSPQSLVFTCEDEHGIAGLTLHYRWRSGYYTRLGGYDYPRLRDGAEYFNLTFYEPIEHMTDTGIGRLHVGTATAEAKGFRGAVIRPLWSAVLPAGTRCGKPGLDLVSTGQARLAELTRYHIACDLAAWTGPEKFAAEHSVSR